MGPGPQKLDAHHERCEHPKKHADEREPEIAKADGFVICGGE
jgi:hypothetical protein